MKKIISAICAVVLLLSSVSVSAFALTKEEADNALAAQNKTFKELTIEKIDVDNSGKIEASDARKVLLCSAGLDEDGIKKENADLDKDGKITAIDARIYLRIAAKLEKPEKYYDVSASQIYSYFTSIINSVKPSGFKFYESETEEIQKVDFVDYNNVIGQMNRQLGYYAQVEDSMKDYDFAAELRSSEGDKSTRYLISKTQIKNENNYPVKTNELACFAAFDDIEKVEYKTNQSFTFERRNSVTNGLIYNETVTGLDSITVYIKPESVSLTGSLDGIFDNLKVGKAFDILSEEDLDDLISSNSSIGSIEGMEDLGKCEISITPKSLQYKNSYITVYFYPETGVPVASVHNLHYIMTMNMNMDIDISAKSLAGDDVAIQILMSILMAQNNGKLLDVQGSMDIANEMNTQTITYFTSNNPAHSPYNPQ